MNLDKLAYDLHYTAVEKGFWDPTKRIEEQDAFVFYAKQLAMIHSEVTEVLEALRKDKGEKEVVEELADILIRVLDLWAGLDSNGITTSSLNDTLLEKAKFNESRDRMHGVAG
jgi:NTP pyrophosphatase (non-canonical NTP hydrolase)